MGDQIRQKATDKRQRTQHWLQPHFLLLCFLFPLPIFNGSLLVFNSIPAFAQTTQDRKAEADRLFDQGIQQIKIGQYQSAIQSLQHALTICRETQEHRKETTTLTALGLAYLRLGDVTRAMQLRQQALTIAKELKDTELEKFVLELLKIDQRNLIKAEADRLFKQGTQQYQTSRFQSALHSWKQVLVIYQEIKDRQGEGATLGSLGSVYDSLGDYNKAIAYHQQALTIAREIHDRQSEGKALGNLGVACMGLGNYTNAVEYGQQWLAIAREIDDRQSEGRALNNLGNAYRNLGNYAEAIEYEQQALKITKETSDYQSQGAVLNGLGIIYKNLGDLRKAIEYYQEALVIVRGISDRQGEGGILNSMGIAYKNLGNYSKAIEYHQQALVIARKIYDHEGESEALGSLGNAYGLLGNYAKAIEYHQQALTIDREIHDRQSEGQSLGNLGVAYFSLGNYAKAIEYHQQALAIAREVGDLKSEGIALNNIGATLIQQKRPELAIVFYKQSINVYESIRTGIQSLPREQQESYINSVADTYRSLADLLLKQDRVLEAQRVLDLLKVQELQNYLRNVRGKLQPAQGISNRPPEQQLSDRFIQSHITQQQAFEQFIRSQEVQELIAQLSPKAQKQSIDLEDFRSLTSTLTALHQDAVLLYPLILPDRVELVLLAPGLAPIHRSSPVKKEDLNRAIANFRAALQNPNSDAKVPAQQLYQWLIAPISADLAKAHAKTILYAPDGQLRYIPLAALHDGHQWLAETYRIQNITAKSLISLSLQRQTIPKVLAAAFSQGSYTFKVGSESFTFNGLPGAAREISLLATLLPGTAQLLDQDFTANGVLTRLNNYNILHLATHGAIVTSDPTQSFILFGDGKPVNLTQIDSDWSFQNTDLVVLSACETGLGGLGNGEEILGLGYVMQKAGAKSTIASLWQVDDNGTQALMDAFYAALKTGKLTKAEALQKAQIVLIAGNHAANGEQRASLRLPSNIPATVSKSPNLSHPYYWAPFILIGNGL